MKQKRILCNKPFYFGNAFFDGEKISISGHLAAVKFFFFADDQPPVLVVPRPQIRAVTWDLKEMNFIEKYTSRDDENKLAGFVGKFSWHILHQV